MKCKNCGAELAENVLFCRECGAKVAPQKRFCRECGAQLEDGVKFCFNCGAKVQIPEVPVDDETYIPSEQKPASSPKIHSFSNAPDAAPEAKAKFSNLGQQVKNNVESSFKDLQYGNKRNGANKILPLTGLAVVLLVFLMFGLLLGRGRSSGKSSNNSA